VNFKLLYLISDYDVPTFYLILISNILRYYDLSYKMLEREGQRGNMVIYNFLLFRLKFINLLLIKILGDWGLGIGDWGLGIGDWGIC
jgi:hypothetical protein